MPVGAREWANWSGSIRFTPAAIEAPDSEEEIVSLVERAAATGQVLRAVGAGHSSSPLVETPDVLVSLERLTGIVEHDSGRCQAVVRGGSSLDRLGPALLERGLALENYGDIDRQSLVGAISTGTHGTGATIGSLSTRAVGARLVLGTGETVDWSLDTELERMQALRLSLGALGIVTELRMQLLPAYRLRRREWCVHIDECLGDLDRLVAENRNFDFYWYPRRDGAKLRTLNPTDDEPHPERSAGGVLHEVGWAHDVIPRVRPLRFHEIEYAVPAEAGPACFKEIRRRIKQRWLPEVAWRVLYRTVAADDIFLSPHHGRASATISVHQNAPLPFRDFFADLEPIFRSYGGRPHWAKVHGLGAHELRELYPDFDCFLNVRADADPHGIFLNEHLRRLLGLEPTLRRRANTRSAPPAEDSRRRVYRRAPTNRATSGGDHGSIRE